MTILTCAAPGCQAFLPCVDGEDEWNVRPPSAASAGWTFFPGELGVRRPLDYCPRHSIPKEPMPTPDDVIPETEMNRRRQVQALAGQLGVLVGLCVDAGTDLHEIAEVAGVDLRGRGARGWGLPPIPSFEPSPESVADAAELRIMMAEARAKLIERSPVTVELDRLLAESEALLDASGNPVPDQRPARMLAVVLRSGQSFQGAVSRTDAGAVKLACLGQNPNNEPGKSGVIMLEMFFDDRDIEVVTVLREVTVEKKPKIWGAE